jgi:phosphoribosyl 1,2-cyclic phosphodiesterase
VVTDKYQFIFDAGTGFQSVKLMEDRTVVIIFTHFHHDHIQGLPFNFNLFTHKGEIILCSSLVNKGVLKNMIQTYFSGGYFPVDIVTMLTHLKFYNFSTVRNMMLPDVDLQTIELSHPGGSMGYKIQTDDGVFVYLQDNEYVPEQLESL